MAILPVSLPIQVPLRPPLFSFSQSLTGSNHLSCLPNRMPIVTKKTTLIRMGGGPRTYPGGVSKWQWKRMQAKKAKQLLKARLCRERQIYEMRKRAELKAAVSELERPWEVVEKAPSLFSIGADEQVKVLADRFQRPGGFDLWTERDGPQLFETVDELPSARFFPKGVVHSVRPYKSIAGPESSVSLDSEAGNDIATSFQEDDFKTHRRLYNRQLRSGSVNKGEDNSDHSDTEDSYSKSSLIPSGSNGRKGKIYEVERNWGAERNLKSSKRELNTGKIRLDRRHRAPGNEIATSFQEDDFKTHRRLYNRQLRSGSVNKGEDNSDHSDYSDTEDSYPKSSLIPSGSNGKKGKIYEVERNWGAERNLKSSKRELNPGKIRLDRRHRAPGPQAHNGNAQNGRGKNSRRSRGSHSEVFDMRLEQDGSYKFQPMKNRSI